MATVMVVDETSVPLANVAVIAVDRPVRAQPANAVVTLAQVTGAVGVGAGPTTGQLFPVGNR